MLAEYSLFPYFRHLFNNTGNTAHAANDLITEIFLGSLNKKYQCRTVLLHLPFSTGYS